MRVASVLVPLPVPEAFDYEVPEGMALARGDHVAAPLGPRLVRGIVAEVFETTGSNRRLKAVEQRLAGAKPLDDRAGLLGRGFGRG